MSTGGLPLVIDFCGKYFGSNNSGQFAVVKTRNGGRERFINIAGRRRLVIVFFEHSDNKTCNSSNFGYCLSVPRLGMCFLMSKVAKLLVG